MRERISGKLGNRNDNAFKLRKLFAMYDKQRTGKVAPDTQSPRLKADEDACCLRPSAHLHKAPSQGSVGGTRGLHSQPFLTKLSPAHCMIACELISCNNMLGNPHLC